MPTIILLNLYLAELNSRIKAVFRRREFGGSEAISFKKSDLIQGQERLILWNWIGKGKDALGVFMDMNGKVVEKEVAFDEDDKN